MPPCQAFPYATQSLSFTPFGLIWLHGTRRIITVGETTRGTGVLEAYDLTESCLTHATKIELQAGIKCISLDVACQSPTIGGFKGSVSVIDIESKKMNWMVDQAHSDLVNSIDSANNGGLEIVTGSRDGFVKVWDPRTSDAVLSVPPLAGSTDCWTVCFGTDHPNADRVVVAGYETGLVRLIDLRTNKVRWEKNVKNGVCHVSFDRKDINMNKLSVACMNGVLNIYDMRTYNEQSGFAGLEYMVGKTTLWGCHFLPQDREIMATCGGNGQMNMYRYSYPMKRSIENQDGSRLGVAGSLECIGKSECLTNQPLVSFDWNRDKRGLFATVSFDQILTIGICANL